MFSNLIESSSHAKEFKRRGSFLLFTTSIYVVLFVITGVISIYAYDARLEQQNLEVVILLPPQEIAPDPQPATPADKPKVTRDNDESNVTERTEAMVSVNRPEIPPDKVTVTPNKNPPIPDHGLWRISDRNKDATAGMPAGPGTPGGGGQVVPPRQVVIDEPPPAPEDAKSSEGHQQRSDHRPGDIVASADLSPDGEKHPGTRKGECSGAYRRAGPRDLSKRGGWTPDAGAGGSKGGAPGSVQADAT